MVKMAIACHEPAAILRGEPKKKYRLRHQLRIVMMAESVPGGFFFQVFRDGGIKIHAGLVGDTDEHEKHVGQLVAEV